MAVAKPCGAKQRCLHLQQVHDSAVQGTLGVAKTLRSNATMPARARRAQQRGARHRGGGKTMRCKAKMPEHARRPRWRGARHSGGVHLLQWNAKMHTRARYPRLRGARHCGGGQILRCKAKMLAPARHPRQEQDTVAVAQHCGAAQQCQHLQDVHDMRCKAPQRRQFFSGPGAKMLAPARCPR